LEGTDVEEPGTRIGVMLVDDDAVVRKSLRELIGSQADMRVAAEAADCDTALQYMSDAGVDVVVVEALLPGMGTCGLVDEVARCSSDMGVIVLTRSERNEDVLRLMQAGASAYLRKSVPAEELLDAVRSVASGGHVLEQEALEAVLNDYCARCRDSHEPRMSPLTLREREVLTLVAEGRSTKEIAAELCLSHKTIEVHRRRIMDKLDLHKVADLVRYAVREGLVGLETA
jgi:DNA-binding NarL/FixJ family response regulator